MLAIELPNMGVKSIANNFKGVDSIFQYLKLKKFKQ